MEPTRAVKVACTCARNENGFPSRTAQQMYDFEFLSKAAPRAVAVGCVTGYQVDIRILKPISVRTPNWGKSVIGYFTSNKNFLKEKVGGI